MMECCIRGVSRWLQDEGKRILEDLRKNGYNVHKVSQYATKSIYQEKYDEFYTEYRTLQALIKYQKR